MKKLWIGIPLVILVFGIMLTGCDMFLENEELIGKWYTSQAAANNENSVVAFEFTSDGQLKISDTTFKYELAGQNITFTTLSDAARGSANFSISGTELTISTGGPITARKYYKPGLGNDNDESATYTVYVKSFGWSATDSYFGTLIKEKDFLHSELHNGFESFNFELTENFKNVTPNEWTEAQLKNYIKELGLTDAQAAAETTWLITNTHGYFGIRIGPNIRTILK
ncbi:hypothetical protein R84B8_02341 [Treponema sp. R8-4-B8]